MKDSFSRIHQMLRNQNFGEVLELMLIDDKTIHPRYEHDLNHAWYVVGDAFFQLGRISEARDAFGKALSERSDDIESLWAQAECYSELNRPDKAEELLRKALELTPGRRELIYNLANSVYDQERLHEAVSLYDQLANMDDDIGQLARKNAELAKGRLSSRPTDQGEST
jgi:tetratricopeptide (TPR) repeat protein